MLQLGLPQYKFSFKSKDDKTYIFDQQRKKYIRLTPEEWVRQNFIRYLVEEKKYPSALIAVEKEINVNGLKKRCDAIVYDFDAIPRIVIEFKAPHINISQATFDQAATYNSKLQLDYFIISNGFDHYFCKLDLQQNKYVFFDEIPPFNLLF